MNGRTDTASSPEAHAFAVPRRFAVRRTVEIAAGKLTVSMQPARPAHVRYLDTFDRRLRRTGLVLEHVTLSGATELRYRELGRPRTLVDAPEAALPAFARDISHAHLRGLLSPLVDVRRLLVVAEARGRLTVSRVRDREDKTVFVAECFAAKRGSVRLTIRPLRGYERFARRAVRRLLKADGIVPDESEPMLCAADGPDAAFGGAEIAPRVNLDPDERSDAACKRVLARLDAVLESNAPGIEADLDPECLHDFRVAVRKARSLLRELKGVFPRSVTRRLRADLGWLGQCTGPVRDLDVHLMDFGLAAHDAEEEADSAIVVLREHLEASRMRAYETLCRTLCSARYRRVRSAFGKFVGTEPPARPRSRNALVPIAALSAQRILKVYRGVLVEGRAIGDESPSESLHDLRKTCKRLRYLLEFFRDVHPAKAVERTIERLKRLQDNLGAFQDVQVQRAVLEEFREHAEGLLDAAAMDAIDRQCASLLRREARTRAAFAARFSAYDSKRAHKEFAAALRRKRK